MNILFPIFLIMQHSLTLAQDDEALNEFTSGNCLFSGDLYTELAKNTNDDFVFSPFSIEAIMGLIYSGAKHNTAEEICSVVHFPNTTELIESAFKDLLTAFKENRDIEIELANKVYVKNDFLLKEEFTTVANQVYQSDPKNISFIEATNEINGWIRDVTKNKIYDIINSSDIKDDTKLILISILSLKGLWYTPFTTLATMKYPFYKNGTDAVPVDTMQRISAYNYHENDELDAKFIDLPFGAGEAYMVVVLPNKRDGIGKLEEQIREVFDQRVFGRQLVDLALPKFKIETTLDFRNILSKLGITEAFSSKYADFSGIAGNKGDLSIDLLKQKSFIDINEGGVEVPPITFVDPPFDGAAVPKLFIADHPFIFYVKLKDVILMAGRVLNLAQ